MPLMMILGIGNGERTKHYSALQPDTSSSVMFVLMKEAWGMSNLWPTPCLLPSWYPHFPGILIYLKDDCEQESSQ